MCDYVLNDGDRVEVFRFALGRYIGRSGTLTSVGEDIVDVLLDGEAAPITFERDNVRPVKAPVQSAGEKP